MVQTRHGSAGAAPFFAVSPAERRLRFVSSDVGLEEEPSVCRSEPRSSLSHRLCAELAHHGDDSRVSPSQASRCLTETPVTHTISLLSLSPSLFCYCLEIMSSEEQNASSGTSRCIFQYFSSNFSLSSL